MRRTAMSEAMLASLAAAPRRAATVWSTQPLQQHLGQGDDDTDDDTDSTDDNTDDKADDDADNQDDDTDDKVLGPAGEKALALMKAKLKAERTRRIAAEKKKADEDKGADDAVATATREIQTRANQRILRSEVKAAAAGKLADPSDAIKFLDLEQFEVGEDGDVDQDEIADAIKELVDKKPYLAAQGGKQQKAPKPDRRNGGGQHDATGSVSAGRARYQARHGKTTTS